MRKAATSEFAKDFWKLLNNSAFGKTIEQVRNRQNVQIVTSRQKALYFIKKPTVQNVILINESTSIFVMKRLKVMLNKPIYVGVAVLDISKQIMYNMYYQHLQKEYGNRLKLLYTDTDSLVCHVETSDIYRDMQKNRAFYDMSGYAKDHPKFGIFNDDTNQKVVLRI